MGKAEPVPHHKYILPTFTKLSLHKWEIKLCCVKPLSFGTDGYSNWYIWLTYVEWQKNKLSMRELNSY